jgi:O-antigen ligase
MAIQNPKSKTSMNATRPLAQIPIADDRHRTLGQNPKPKIQNPKFASPWAPIRRAAVLLTLLAAVLAQIGALAYLDRYLNAGVTWGAAQTPIAGTGGSPLGVNVFLEKESDPANVRRTLDLAQAGGFTWIRQGFPWNDIEIAGKGDFTDTRNGTPHSAWDKYDYIVEQAQARGLQILARLDAPPEWARRAPNYQNPCGGTAVDFSHSPPARLSDYADFVSAVVSRYKGQIRYFQIWNEPNLIGEWPPQPNPVEYTALLKAAYQAAHAANPDAVIVMAPLAQTVGEACNPSDLSYLQGLYDAGAQPYFDIASVMAYGLDKPPTDRRADFNRINFSRPVLTRDVMTRNGDGAKGVWASEYGWVSLPADWNADSQNKPGIWGDVSPAQQAQYLVQGYQRARAEWPWMGPMFVWHLRDPAPLPHEPQPYFGILGADFSPRPAYRALQDYSARFPIADTGAATPDSPAFVTAGTWETATLAGRPVYTATTPDSIGTLTFQGNRIDLVFAAGPQTTRIQATLDGAPPPGWPVDSSGQAILTMPAAGGTANQAQPAAGWPAPPGMMAVQLTIASGLPETRHTLTIRPGNVDAPLTLLGFVVARENRQGDLYAGAYGLLLGLAFWLGVRSTFALLAVPAAGRRVLAGIVSAGADTRTRLVLAGMVLALAAYYLIPVQPVALLALAVWFVLAVLRPDLALVTTAAAIPFSWVPRPLFHWTFPLAETTLWLTLLAWAVRFWILDSGFRRSNKMRAQIQNPKSKIQNPDLFGAPALALLAVGTFSLLTIANVDYLKDSLHAYRWLIVEPVLFYFLSTDILRGTRQALRLADGYVAGAALAAAVALVFGFLQVPDTTLDVQGVVTFQGLFPSHDNLGLFVGRALAFTAALVLLLRAPEERSRRRYYLAAAAIMFPAVVLSYSRGAWLAVVVALGLTLWLVGARAARLFAAALVAGTGALFLAAEANLLPERILHAGSGAIRLDLWVAAGQMLRDHPMFGIGLDQFLNQYQGPYFDPSHATGMLISHPHNLILDCWLSLGIIGLLVAGWLAGRIVAGGMTLLRSTDARSRALAGGVLAGLVAMLVHGLIDNSYFLQDLALIFWLFCALLQILWKGATVPPGPRPVGRGAPPDQ